MSRATSIAERLRDPDNLVVRYDAINELERLDLINKELLAALKEVLAAERATATPPRTAMQAEAKIDRIRAAVAQAESAIAKARGTNV